MLRIGRVIILGRDERLSSPTKHAQQQEAVIIRQHDLLCEVEAQRDHARAGLRECNELLLEQQQIIEQQEQEIATMRRHPVSQPRPEDRP